MCKISAGMLVACHIAFRAELWDAVISVYLIAWGDTVTAAILEGLLTMCNFWRVMSGYVKKFGS